MKKIYLVIIVLFLGCSSNGSDNKNEKIRLENSFAVDTEEVVIKSKVPGRPKAIPGYSEFNYIPMSQTVQNPGIPEGSENGENWLINNTGKNLWITVLRIPSHVNPQEYAYTFMLRANEKKYIPFNFHFISTRMGLRRIEHSEFNNTYFLENMGIELP